MRGSLRFVYVLRSTTNPTQRYIGLTSDIATRITAHNAGQSPYTAQHRPWVLVAAIELENEARAVAFEKYLKSGSGRAFATRHFGI